MPPKKAGGKKRGAKAENKFQDILQATKEELTAFEENTKTEEDVLSLLYIEAARGIAENLTSSMMERLTPKIAQMNVHEFVKEFTNPKTKIKLEVVEDEVNPEEEMNADGDHGEYVNHEVENNFGNETMAFIEQMEAFKAKKAQKYGNILGDHVEAICKVVKSAKSEKADHQDFGTDV